jgi:Holliday junction DNA helicase RuvA
MYAYIKGKISSKTPTEVIVETGGIGFHLNISLYTYSKVETLDEVKLWTHFYVKEAIQTLFGFYDEEERSLFRLLISVSGIGPNTARIINSSMTPQETKQAILAEDSFAFNRVKGVGPKTAKRLIIELKDKLLKSGIDPVITMPEKGISSARQEAQSALIALGFNRNQVHKAMQKLAQSDPPLTDTEEWIKQGLKELSSFPL